MFKRIIGLVLSLMMIASAVSVGVSAAYQQSTAVSGSSATVDGVSYTVVSTESALRTALAAGGNIMLANDIALESSAVITVKAGTLLDGNGYAITYSELLKNALLKFAVPTISSGKSTTASKVTIRNVSFGTQAAPITLSGVVSLAEETYTDTGKVQNRLIWENVDFHLQNKSVDAPAKYGLLFLDICGVHEYYGCTMNATVTSTGSLIGGWIGTSNGDLLMRDCTTMGAITGNLGVAGFVGQVSSSVAEFDHCVNHASVTASAGYCGGLVSNAGLSVNKLYFTDCKNYGTITSSGTDYSSMAGGMIGRLSNIQTPDQSVSGFFGCMNFGTISGYAAGGILGRHHEADSAFAQFLNFRGCINFGTVKGTKYIGGIAGAISPKVTDSVMIDCANIGKISSSSGYIGNFAGLMSGTKLQNCYAAGYVAGTASKAGVIFGQIGETYVAEASALKAETMTMVAPTVTDVFCLTNLKDTALQDATKLTDATIPAALAEMKEIYGFDLITHTDTVSSVGSYLVMAAPQIRGVQQSVSTENGKTDLRFAATLNALKPYQNVGFRVRLTAHEQNYDIDRPITQVYTRLNAMTVNGELTRVTAASLGAKYLCAFTLTGIPVTEHAIIQITPYAIGTDGTEYLGTTQVAVCSNGVYHMETMLLNGAPLEQYSIVYPASGSKNEQMLAQRLAQKIAEYTGHTLSCYSDATAKRRNEILIGKTNRYAPSVSGRWIYCPSQKDRSIVLTAANTTALSEVVEYFLESLQEKRASGNAAWTISGSISVPIDEELTVMAYNTGAIDSTDIKKAEWDLIQSYLPDILTMQEPWAAWLDDFLNDYAVKPSTAFAAISTNVMSGSVDNKAFTGSGYYGVYWGAPRWKPTNFGSTINKGGAASYSVILYAKDRFTVDTSKSGTFWLSASPNLSGSTFEGSSHCRCATYATLTDKNTGEQFVVVNVHLDYNAGVQADQVNVLRTQLAKLVGTSIPIIVTGDMNATRNTDGMNAFFDNGWTSAYTLAEESHNHNRNIDWILMNNASKFDVTYYSYCHERTFYNTQWLDTPALGKPSDHPPVYAEMTINTGADRPAPNTEQAPTAVHKYGEWTKDPSTTNTHYHVCDCGERETGVCEMTETMVLVGATATTQGQVLYTCGVCGRTEIRLTEKLSG